MEENEAIENNTTKILREVPARTDKTVKANRQDIILVKKDMNRTNLIHVTIPHRFQWQEKGSG